MSLTPTYQPMSHFCLEFLVLFLNVLLQILPIELGRLVHLHDDLWVYLLESFMWNHFPSRVFELRKVLSSCFLDFTHSVHHWHDSIF